MGTSVLERTKERADSAETMIAPAAVGGKRVWGNVTFRYQDRAHGNTSKYRTLSGTANPLLCPTCKVGILVVTRVLPRMRK